MIACLKWWVGLNNQGDTLRLLSIRTQVLDAAVLATVDDRIIPLGTIRTFVSPKGIVGLIPLDGPLPPHMLPANISKQFTSESLIASFPWAELTIPEWLAHLCSPLVIGRGVDYDITLSSTWAEKVLIILSRCWPSISASAKQQITSTLKNVTCIPTTGGMKAPELSYFANANIFHDLPVVTLPSGVAIKGSLERVLEALGVRKHVDLQVVFNRYIFLPIFPS